MTTVAMDLDWYQFKKKFEEKKHFEAFFNRKTQQNFKVLLESFLAKTLGNG